MKRRIFLKNSEVTEADIVSGSLNQLAVCKTQAGELALINAYASVDQCK